MAWDVVPFCDSLVISLDPDFVLTYDMLLVQIAQIVHKVVQNCDQNGLDMASLCTIWLVCYELDVYRKCFKIKQSFSEVD